MSNVDYLISSLAMLTGDIQKNIYSDNVYNQALISSIRLVNNTLGGKYTIVDEEVQRCDDTTPNPFIDAEDEALILAGASYIIRTIPFAGSNAFANGVSWSTPELQYSGIQANKSSLTLLQSAFDYLQKLMRSRLGRSVKTFLPTYNYGIPAYRFENFVEKDEG